MDPLPLARGPAHRLSRQIAAQIAAEVHAGKLPPGERLPSVRRLARRYGVAVNTAHAAYRLLARARLIELRPGSGAFASRCDISLDPLSAFLADCREAGMRATTLADRLELWCASVRQRRFALLEPWEDVAPLLRIELERLTGAPVSDVRGSPGGCADLTEAIVFGRPAALARYGGGRIRSKRCQVPHAHCVPLTLAGPREAAMLASCVGPGGVLAIVSRSRSVRRAARAHLAGARQRGLGLLVTGGHDARTLDRVRRISGLTCADVGILPRVVQAMSTPRERNRVRPLYLLSEHNAARIAVHFGPLRESRPENQRSAWNLNA